MERSKQGYFDRTKCKDKIGTVINCSIAKNNVSELCNSKQGFKKELFLYHLKAFKEIDQYLSLT